MVYWFQSSDAYDEIGHCGMAHRQSQSQTVHAGQEAKIGEEGIPTSPTRAASPPS